MLNDAWILSRVTTTDRLAGALITGCTNRITVRCRGSQREQRDRHHATGQQRAPPNRAHVPPSSGFGAFQGIEAGIYLVLAAACSASRSR